MGLTKVQNRMVGNASVNVKDFGATGDGVTDDTTAFQNSITEAKLLNLPVVVPYGKYLITSTLDCWRVTMSGQTATDETDLFDKSPWPVIVGGGSLTEIIRIGSTTSSGEVGQDRTTLENFTIDMTSSPNNTKGVYCDYGVVWKTVKNIYVRGATVSTTAELATANQTGFHFAMATSADQGIYYLTLENLTSYYLYRGFYTKGDINDGMRVCNIGRIIASKCQQGITFIDAETNNISSLNITGFMSDYAPNRTGGSTTIDPVNDHWGVFMDHKNNTIGNMYIEGIADATSPHTLISARHSILMYRDLDVVPNSMQIIMDDGVTRIEGTRVGNNRSLVVSPEMVEVGTIGGVQTQESLTVNPYFRFWTGGATNIADATEFAYAWTAVKEGTGTLDVVQSTGTWTAASYSNSAKIKITTPQVGKIYGFKQDLATFYPLSGGKLYTIAKTIEWVTVAVKVQADTAQDPVTMRIKVDTGVAVTTEDYTIDYEHWTSGVDEKIRGDDGDFWTLIHHVDVGGSPTKFEVSVGIYTADTVTKTVYVDSVMLVAGRHTQYGVHPYHEPPKYLCVPEGNANTNTPSGGTNHALPIFGSDGTLLGYVPVYSSTW
jgi:hypothetical protein